ncbi:2-oxoacid:ferredoxin oxidoreductase subunit beta [Saccharicrinis sp. FJH54]|uniref:2-oxoacid:ferredoxin oxidoreductase subunit beta n=1 Tax=Saccharicrinis sp. FJH54 TaxID=3344665 RepID=UPI0035D3EE16
MEIKETFSPKDYKSDQNVRWCPGCGDHAILNTLHKAMATIGVDPDNIAVISGIGCSSRLPYYMNTYGFHTIHGRAAAIASGVKSANPDLTVWQISGDGDALAIGGNHFIHAVRRNIDINIILFNNQIYGLTKGQYSPTSKKGFISKTSPFGTIEYPFRPGELALGARGTFFARSIDTDMKLSQEVLIAAHEHKGTSVVEVLQNCVIFNDDTHAAITDKAHRADRTILLEHGKPMLFGQNMDKGLVLNGMKLKVVEVGKDGITADDILIHDAEDRDATLHNALANMEYPAFPVALGVIRAAKTSTYNDNLVKQIKDVQANSRISKFEELARSGSVWEVE